MSHYKRKDYTMHFVCLRLIITNCFWMSHNLAHLELTILGVFIALRYCLLER